MQTYLRLLLTLLIPLLTACKEEVLHRLSERDANKAVALLMSNKVIADKRSDGADSWAIAVEKNDVPAALQLLANSKLFPDSPAETSKKESWGLNKDQSRFYYERALARELEATLLTVPGVSNAKVHLHLPVQDPFFGGTKAPQGGSASVFILADDKAEFRIEEIRLLISGGSGVPTSGVQIVRSSVVTAPAEVASGLVVPKIEEQSSGGKVSEASWLSSIRIPQLGLKQITLGLFGLTLILPFLYAKRLLMGGRTRV